MPRREATKFSQYLLTSDKTYVATLCLGVSTDSGDADGEVLEERALEDISRERIESALDDFRGDIEQVPSMFSAVKHQGQPLYKLARQGIEIEREARPVTVYRNVIVDYAGDRLTLEVHCSKGTYVRTIAHDLGEQLGCGAHVVALRRTTAGPYQEADLVTLDEMHRMAELDRLDELLQPVATAVGQWPTVELAAAPAFYLKQGQPVLVPHAPTEGWVRLYELENDDGRFIGVGEILTDGRVAPRRLIV